MRRREFITLIGGAAAWPFMARAQQTSRLGVLSGRGRQEPNFVAFFDELQQFGIIEGKNLIVDPSGFGLRQDRFVDLAIKLVTSGASVILCAGDAAISAAQASTPTYRPGRFRRYGRGWDWCVRWRIPAATSPGSASCPRSSTESAWSSLWMHSMMPIVWRYFPTQASLHQSISKNCRMKHDPVALSWPSMKLQPRKKSCPRLTLLQKRAHRQ